ncbi:MAG: hypothetical protein WAO00_15950 [Chthoniobacterales bacterium]
MSPRTRIITLNLGSQSIELAEFRVQPPGGLVLCDYRSRAFLADPARYPAILQMELDVLLCTLAQ